MVLSGVGATLREERLRRSFSLEDVSNVTRIAARYLEAIENDRPSDLPGIVFTRGFVRQYARFLGIPDENLLSQLPKVDVETAALPAAPPKRKKIFWTRQRVSRAATAGGFGLAAAAAIAAWVYLDLTPVVRQASSAALSAAARTISNRRALAASGASVSTPPPRPSTSSPPVQAAGAPELTSAPEPGEVTTVAGRAIQVLLTARANAWVQVVADGKPAFTGLLRANDSREISGNELVKVMTGNAGGLQISLNGKELDPIGPTGQVRTVRLTAEGLLPDPKNPAPISDADPL